MARVFGKLLVVIFLLVVLGLVGTSMLGRQMAQPGPLTEEARVLIQPGTSTRAMATQLQQQNVIAHPRLFEATVRLTGLAPTLQAGEYVFEPEISLRQVINKLALGRTASRSVTIPEGYTVRQALKVLEAKEGLTGEARPIPPEGYVFPDTYSYTHGTKRADLLAVMQKRAKDELAAVWAKRDLSTPYQTPEDLLIMASIVEKEAASTEEMPQIAAVFVNRLHKGMRLQADPTVIYGAELEDNDLKTKDMKEPHPFNTYVNDGLPPTAIANPGKAALEAAANPARSEALFFVSLPDRSGHVFSTTYAAHDKAVKEYWRAYRQQQKESK